MWVEIVLGTAGTALVGGILVTTWRALTRAEDRVQMATGCLFLCTLMYFVTAWHLFKIDGVSSRVGVAIGVYASALYFVMGALAVHHVRWAWRAAIGALGLHLILGVASGLITLFQRDTSVSAYAGLGLWLFFGVLGLWACLHQGSRDLINKSNAFAK